MTVRRSGGPDDRRQDGDHGRGGTIRVVTKGGRVGPRRGSPSAVSMAAALGILAVVLGGCAARGGPGSATALPPVPEVRGAPELYVAYPDSADRIAASDSNFIFGTAGSGEAELTIDGRRVEVQPNGSFLAWLPVPDRTAGDTAVYRLVARAGELADTLHHPVVLPARPFEGEGRAWIDTASVTGLAPRWALPAERLELQLRTAPGAEMAVLVAPAGEAGPGDTVPGDTAAAGGDTLAGPGDSVYGGRDTLVGTRDPAPVIAMEEVEPGRHRLRIRADSLARAVGREPPFTDTLRLRFRATAGADTSHHAARWPLRVLDPAALPLGRLREAPDSVHGQSGVIPGRPTPYGSYAWLLPDGTEALVDGRRGDRLRLQLLPDLSAWVAREDVELPGGQAARVLRGRVGWVRADASDDLRVRVPLTRRVPAAVRLEDERTVALTLFGALSGTGRMVYPADDGPAGSLLASMDWAQLPGPRYRLRVRLERPLWGWQLRWDGSSAVLEIRRPPEIDRDRPLRGQRIAVDPGHPPVGAEGPTGLTEADANLGVARTLVELLEEAGAEPVLVRRDTSAVGLYERRRRAREAGATALVSIHNNALPDGVRPFGREGTSTYYFHPHARKLGRWIQRGMLREMGLRDLGLRWGNLALPRESWMPSVLAEGAFMMFPRQEAALRTEEFRRAYARGVRDGLREFYRERARWGHE